MNPAIHSGDLDDIMLSNRADPASMAHSIVMDTPQNEPSPFSSKKVVHESDTPHSTECKYKSNRLGLIKHRDMLLESFPLK